MGFFDTLRSKKDNMPSSWKKLESASTLETIKKDSHDHTVVIYKHSTSCSLSHVKYSELSKDWDDALDTLDFYYLDLLSYRAISNQIEKVFGIRHESPQILVVKNGKVTFHTSHMRVSVQAIKSAI